VFTFFLAPCACHPDRSATGIPTYKELSGAEWRDPEGVSSAVPHQGVLTRLLAITARPTNELLVNEASKLLFACTRHVAKNNE
jgi:hypothetical protein